MKDSDAVSIPVCRGVEQSHIEVSNVVVLRCGVLLLWWGSTAGSLGGIGGLEGFNY